MADTNVLDILTATVIPRIRERMDLVVSMGGTMDGSAWPDRIDRWLSMLSNPQLWKQPVTVTEADLTDLATQVQALDSQDLELFREELQQLVLRLQTALLGETVVRSRIRTLNLRVIDCLVRCKRLLAVRLQDLQTDGSRTQDHPEVLPALQSVSFAMQRYQNTLWAQEVDARQTQLNNLEYVERSMDPPLPAQALLEKLRLLSSLVDRYHLGVPDDEWLPPDV
ncbi:MAG: hypothetical protein RLY31_2762 [Bacteroidota bacterium]|jgi:hypothetical protein